MTGAVACVVACAVARIVARVVTGVVTCAVANVAEIGLIEASGKTRIGFDVIGV